MAQKKTTPVMNSGLTTNSCDLDITGNDLDITGNNIRK